MWPDPKDVVQEPTVHLWQQWARLQSRMLEPSHIDVSIAGGKLLAHCCTARLEVMLVVENEVIPAQVDVKEFQQVTVGPVGVWVPEECRADSPQARIYVDVGV